MTYRTWQSCFHAETGCILSGRILLLINNLLFFFSKWMGYIDLFLHLHVDTFKSVIGYSNAKSNLTLDLFITRLFHLKMVIRLIMNSWLCNMKLYECNKTENSRGEVDSALLHGPMPLICSSLSSTKELVVTEELQQSCSCYGSNKRTCWTWQSCFWCKCNNIYVK